MKKTNLKNAMKLPETKKIVVKLTTDNIFEFDVDTSIFDDPFLEAATRAVEKTRKQKHGLICAVTECWDKKIPNKSELYNSYWILVNASCYTKAELLRDKFKMQTNCDLAKEPINGRRSSK